MKLQPGTNSRAVIRAFQTTLQEWYKAEQRPLPWRTDPSVYRTVVSEFMCQQTRIATVVPYFDRWMKSYPDFAALASAPEEEVLKHWEGLGYYRRARYLQAIARAVAGTHPPRTPDGWARLPGVGPYTAAAISSIAFGRAAACVDGNVVRILCRLTGDETAFRNSATAVTHFTPLAARLLDDDNPGIHNQAMMELGATICHRKKPLCMVCPVRDLCRSGPEGSADHLPRIERTPTVKQTVHRVWLVRRGRLLMHRLPDESKRMAQLHELPTAEQVAFDPDRPNGTPCVKKTRAITRYRITEWIWFPTKASKLALPKTRDRGFHWVPLAKLEEIPLSGPHRRWVNEFLDAKPKAK